CSCTLSLHDALPILLQSLEFRLELGIYVLHRLDELLVCLGSGVDLWHADVPVAVDAQLDLRHHLDERRRYRARRLGVDDVTHARSEEHTSELQSREK